MARASGWRRAIRKLEARATLMEKSFWGRRMLLSVNPLEDRIGYKFRNPLLLAEALTHPSVKDEPRQHRFDNQRLEFLGDTVWQFVITEHLYRHFNDEAEGKLTKLRARLVSGQALAVRAAALELGRYLIIGRGEEASGGRERSSTLADAFEALVGAIYLDSDLATVRQFILEQAAVDLARVVEEPVDINPKGHLQELLQTISPRSPVYEVISQSGPDHEKTFVVRVVWEGISLGEGTGRSKWRAETAAAVEAMREKRWEQAAEKNSTTASPTKGGSTSG